MDVRSLEFKRKSHTERDFKKSKHSWPVPSPVFCEDKTTNYFFLNKSLIVVLRLNNPRGEVTFHSIVFIQQTIQAKNSMKGAMVLNRTEFAGQQYHLSISGIL